MPSVGELTEGWVAQVRGDALAQGPGDRRQIGEQLDEFDPAVLSFAGGGPSIDCPVDQLSRCGQRAFGVRVHPAGARRVTPPHCGCQHPRTGWVTQGVGKVGVEGRCPAVTCVTDVTNCRLWDDRGRPGCR